MAKKEAAKETDVDLIPFLNILVTVIPVLLSTAVFSRMAITQLNLPTVAGAGAASAAAEGKNIIVEVILRSGGLEVSDGKRVVRAFGLEKGNDPLAPDDDPGYKFRELNEYLLTIKGSYPDKTDATILIEPHIQYHFVINTLDAVRLYKETPSSIETEKVFPDIVVGDAP